MPNTVFAHTRDYRDGWKQGDSDAINDISPANACDGHSDNWCTGYNDGFKSGNEGSPFFMGNTQQSESSNVEIHCIHLN